jgi:hypothetical protein
LPSPRSSTTSDSASADAFQPPLIYRGPIGERLLTAATTTMAEATTATESVAETWRQIERDARAGGRPEVCAREKFLGCGCGCGCECKLYFARH